MTTAAATFVKTPNKATPVRASTLAKLGGIAAVGIVGGGLLAKAGISLNDLSFPVAPPSAAAPVVPAETFALSARSATPVNSTSMTELTMPAVAKSEPVVVEVSHAVSYVGNSIPQNPPNPITSAEAAAAISASIELKSVTEAEVGWILSVFAEHHSLVLTGNYQNAGYFIEAFGEFESARKEIQSESIRKKSGLQQLKAAIDGHYTNNIQDLITVALKSGIVVRAEQIASK